MMAQQTNVEVISNNIANVNTTGFKRARAEFTDLIYQSQRRQGSLSSDSGTIVLAGIEIGLGVKPAAVNRISTQGGLTPTEHKPEIALEGTRFQTDEIPDGPEAYSPLAP